MDARFEQLVVDLVASALSGESEAVVIAGREMVDWLRSEGMERAAVRVESILRGDTLRLIRACEVAVAENSRPDPQFGLPERWAEVPTSPEDAARGVVQTFQKRRYEFDTAQLAGHLGALGRLRASSLDGFDGTLTRPEPPASLPVEALSGLCSSCCRGGFHPGDPYTCSECGTECALYDRDTGELWNPSLVTAQVQYGDVVRAMNSLGALPAACSGSGGEMPLGTLGYAVKMPEHYVPYVHFKQAGDELCPVCRIHERPCPLCSLRGKLS